MEFSKNKVVRLLAALSVIVIIGAFLGVYSGVFHSVPSSNGSFSFSANAVWILNVGWVKSNQFVLQTNLSSVVANLNGSSIKYVFVFVGNWNSSTNDIDYSMSDEVINSTIVGLHGINVTVLAWVENGDGGLDVRMANRHNLYASIVRCMGKGFDGYNDDVEAYKGSLQDWIDYLNDATPVLHGLGKLMTADVGIDWKQQINSHLHMDYIVSMFYGPKSFLENSEVEAFWQEDFGQYFLHNSPPGSPMIIGIMNFYGNDHPLSWQLQKIGQLLSKYDDPKLVGFSLWTYEYMGTSSDDWRQWNSWIGGFEHSNGK